MHKLLVFRVPVDLSTIVDGQTDSQIKATSRITREMERLWRVSGNRGIRDLRSQHEQCGTLDYVGSNQVGSIFIVKGPHGSGVKNFLIDLVYIVTQGGCHDQLEAIRQYTNNLPQTSPTSRGISFMEILKNFKVLLGRSLPLIRELITKSSTAKAVNYPSQGRLAVFDDVGGKKRYIALGNWVIQGTLRPLHNLLMDLLREIPQDCTFDQDKIFRWSKKIVRQGKPIYSLDLSSATDRLPLALQTKILYLMTKDQKLAEA